MASRLLLIFTILLSSVDAIPKPPATSHHHSIIVATTLHSSQTSYSCPPSTTSTIPTSLIANPCAAIASSVAGASNSSTPRVPAQLGFDCLNDIPLDVNAAVMWLESLRPYIEWQTTTSYLRDPPEGYLQPAIDIWAEIDDIISGVQNGRFRNEWEFEFTLYRLFQRSYDGHFRYYPNLIGNVIIFGRPLSLVSVSVDGTEKPKPYVYTDILYASNSSVSISAITKINGEDVVSYLEDWSQYGSLQDPDALYNNVFVSLAATQLASFGAGAGNFAGAGRGAYVFPGDTTVLDFENGTSATFDNFARVLQNFSGITSGQDVYAQYVNLPASVLSSSTSRTLPTPTPRPGFPKPEIVQINNFIGGYYLSEPRHQDVAVLSVSNFVILASAGKAYQDVAFDFINQAKADGKTKLVIDLSSNGGGDLFHSYNLFLNLFPDLVPYGGTRFRAHDAFNLIGKTVSDRITTYPYDPRNVSDEEAIFIGFPFNYRADLDTNNENFHSWDDKYGPNTFNGDNFTEIIRWNFSDPSIVYSGEIVVNGFLNRTGIVPERPFAAENIIMLYDGYCASSCVQFSEFMRQHAGVKSVAVGGRPQSRGAMQGLGGTKGYNNYDFKTLTDVVNATYALAPDLASYFNTTSLQKYFDDTPYRRGGLSTGSINVRDGIREGDENQMPLQFVYEAADCRIWYTPEMTVDISAQWEKAADVAWNGDSCIWGSVFESKSEKKRDKVIKRRTATLSDAARRELEDASSRLFDTKDVPSVQGFMAP